MSLRNARCNEKDGNNNIQQKLTLTLTKSNQLMASWGLALTSSESDANGRDSGSVRSLKAIRDTHKPLILASCGLCVVKTCRDQCLLRAVTHATVPILLASHLIGTHWSRVRAKSQSLLAVSARYWPRTGGLETMCQWALLCGRQTRVQRAQYRHSVWQRRVCSKYSAGCSHPVFVLSFLTPVCQFSSSPYVLFPCPLVLYFLFLSFFLELFLF